MMSDCVLFKRRVNTYLEVTVTVTSTPTTVTITDLRVYPGTSAYVDWGNGFTGQYSTEHSHSGAVGAARTFSAGTYTVKIGVNNTRDNIANLWIRDSTSPAYTWSGTINKRNPLPSGIKILKLGDTSGSCGISYDGISCPLPTTIEEFHAKGTLTGFLYNTKFRTMPNLEQFVVALDSGYESFVCDLDRTSLPSGITNLTLYSGDSISTTGTVSVFPSTLTTLVLYNLDNIIYDFDTLGLPSSLVTFSCNTCSGISPISIWNTYDIQSLVYSNNGLTQSEVDAILKYLADNEALYTHPDPFIGLSIGNAAPSAAGLANRAILLAAGWTVGVAS